MRSPLIIKNNKWDEKRKTMDKKLKKQCNHSSIQFISHDNIVRNMLNNSNFHLTCYRAKTFV